MLVCPVLFENADSCTEIRTSHYIPVRTALYRYTGFKMVVRAARLTTGCATRRAMGRGPRCTTDRQLRHRAAGLSGRRTDDTDTYHWKSRPRAPVASEPDRLGRASRLHLLGPAAIHHDTLKL